MYALKRRGDPFKLLFVLFHCITAQIFCWHSFYWAKIIVCKKQLECALICSSGEEVFKLSQMNLKGMVRFYCSKVETNWCPSGKQSCCFRTRCPSIKHSLLIAKNLTIFNLICWLAGLIVSLSKRLMFQVLFIYVAKDNSCIQKVQSPTSKV